jgi:hypothetical protein
MPRLGSDDAGVKEAAAAGSATATTSLKSCALRAISSSRRSPSGVKPAEAGPKVLLLGAAPVAPSSSSSGSSLIIRLRPMKRQQKKNEPAMKRTSFCGWESLLVTAQHYKDIG